ncbi:PA3496 family putative envelope integrity protein [Metapseudomonas otitidis]|uniref:PA3496 family putative envelope integrity protein n=1 Tax=Metapseudomonas otitidis TaxID=319939 RepID=UPI00366D1228
MSTVKEEIEIEEDFIAEETEEAEAPAEVAKTNLTKRRIIDNYLEERRLQKQLNDYDFDL